VNVRSQIFESKLKGRRRMGKPRLKWLKDVEKFLQKTKVKRWRQKALDREEKASVIKESRALRVPYSRGSK